MIPHPKKAAKGGEDALYVSPGLIAVADGVGGWGEMGVDPGLFSKELCLKYANNVNILRHYHQKHWKPLD